MPSESRAREYLRREVPALEGMRVFGEEVDDTWTRDDLLRLVTLMGRKIRAAEAQEEARDAAWLENLRKRAGSMRPVTP